MINHWTEPTRRLSRKDWRDMWKSIRKQHSRKWQRNSDAVIRQSAKHWNAIKSHEKKDDSLQRTGSRKSKGVSRKDWRYWSWRDSLCGWIGNWWVSASWIWLRPPRRKSNGIHTRKEIPKNKYHCCSNGWSDHCTHAIQRNNRCSTVWILVWTVAFAIPSWRYCNRNGQCFFSFKGTSESDCWKISQKNHFSSSLLTRIESNWKFLAYLEALAQNAYSWLQFFGWCYFCCFSNLLNCSAFQVG